MITFENNQVVEYRLGRAGRHDVDFGDWQTGPIYVKKTEAGEMCNMTPITKPQLGLWAEYDPRRDYCGEDDGIATFICEDYYMEIKISSDK